MGQRNAIMLPCICRLKNSDRLWHFNYTVLPSRLSKRLLVEMVRTNHGEMVRLLLVKINEINSVDCQSHDHSMDFVLIINHNLIPLLPLVSLARPIPLQARGRVWGNACIEFVRMAIVLVNNILKYHMIIIS